MATVRNFLVLVRRVNVGNIRLQSTESTIQKFQQENNEHFGSLAVQIEQKPVDLLPQAKFKNEEDLEDHDGESEHFSKISDDLRPSQTYYQRKIESLLLERNLLGKHFLEHC